MQKSGISKLGMFSSENLDIPAECDVFRSPIEELVSLVNQEVTKRLDAIEERIDIVTDACEVLEEKVEQLSTFLNDRVGAYTESTSLDKNCGQTLPIGSGITIITLNSADDYPDGSWLGDETRPELRVRCPMTPTELFHINTTCTTAEKMALTLLDYLFDRETQACSNISGTGKHKKKKLDPLFIYGIQCHLIAHFGITGEDWARIKQNIDSKCRTAFRRKMKGLPLFPKASNQNQQANDEIESLIPNGVEGLKRSFNIASSSSDSLLNSVSGDEGDQMEIRSVEPAIDDSFFTQMLQPGELIRTDHGDIQVLRATPEQLAQIQQTHQIQLLSGGHILAMPVNSNADQTTTKENT